VSVHVKWRCHVYCCVTERSDLDLSLDQFLAKNTSEDNASFSELMKENDQKHRVKHAWLFEKEQHQDQVSSSNIFLQLS